MSRKTAPKQDEQWLVVRKKRMVFRPLPGFLRIIPFWRLRDFFWKLRAKLQRFRRGYADTDVWNLNTWFLSTVRPMLQQLHDTHAGYPVNITNELWEEKLRTMIRLLDGMDEEKLTEGLSTDEVIKNAVKIQEKLDRNKDRFFELFAKYFWNLWD